MEGNSVTQFTDVEEFKQAVEDADGDVLSVSHEVKGTPMGCTVETLIECAEQFAEPMIVVSSRTDAPVPKGLSLKVEQLHDVADLIESLGTRCIEDVEKSEDGTVTFGYHFD